MASSVVTSSSSRVRSALESFFTPASVAVIGATEREGSVGRTILENLVHSSYRGHVFAVNPKHSKLLGTKCYLSVAALPEPVDLAVIATPAVTVPGVIRECGCGRSFFLLLPQLERDRHNHLDGNRLIV